MDITVYSLIGLLSLVVLSYICTFILHIFNDRFYSIFHLAGGILSVYLFYSVTKNYLLSITLTIMLGIAWEIVEWGQWKLILKKKKYRPRFDDTRNDLILDFVGSITGALLLSLPFLR